MKIDDLFRNNGFLKIINNEMNLKANAYFEMTALSDFSISLVDSPLALATALFLTYCFPMIWTITLPLFR